MTYIIYKGVELLFGVEGTRDASSSIEQNLEDVEQNPPLPAAAVQASGGSAGSINRPSVGPTLLSGDFIKLSRL